VAAIERHQLAREFEGGINPVTQFVEAARHSSDR
jgi:hypothetical protein